jgi:diguanylate cyclase (GGDEF)-like protein
MIRSLVLTCCVVWCAGVMAQAGASPDPRVIRFCVDPDWPPFEQIDAQGQHVGIAADLLRLVAQRSGLTLQLLPTKDWDDSLTASQAGRCELMSFLNQSPKRDGWLLFTDPVLVDENVLIAREEHGFVSDLASLSGETMVLPKGTSVEERVRRDYPNLSIVLVDSEAQAFKQVSERQADLTMRSLIVAANTIRSQGWFNLKIAGQVPNYGNQLRIGVLKSEPNLLGRLNAGVASITPVERQKIVDQHIAIQVVSPINYRLIGALAAVWLTAMLTSAYWIRRLRRVNAELQKLSLTDALTGLRNRTGFDALYQHELERSRRQKQALSVVLVDIDFFKRINDELGHPEGDRVLQEVATLLRETARGIDHILRWGGEEFLLLCPATGSEQAQRLAERLVQAVRTRDFRLGRPLTLSAGVATLELQDQPGHMFAQVDGALYLAKTQGRDRVVVATRPQGGS